MAIIHTLTIQRPEEPDLKIELLDDRSVVIVGTGNEEVGIRASCIPALVEALEVLLTYKAPPVGDCPKIIVTPEGRDECWWVVDRDSLIAWIEWHQFDGIHNFTRGGPVMLGADHSPESVIADIRAADRIALLTGAARRDQMNHALAVISPKEILEIYDIGDVTEDQFDIQEATP